MLLLYFYCLGCLLCVCEAVCVKEVSMSTITGETRQHLPITLRVFFCCCCSFLDLLVCLFVCGIILREVTRKKILVYCRYDATLHNTHTTATKSDTGIPRHTHFATVLLVAVTNYIINSGIDDSYWRGNVMPKCIDGRNNSGVNNLNEQQCEMKVSTFD